MNLFCNVGLNNVKASSGGTGQASGSVAVEAGGNGNVVAEAGHASSNVAAEVVRTSSFQGGNVPSQAGGSSSVQDEIPADISTQSSQANDSQWAFL